VSASVNLPLHHKVQMFSSGTGSPGVVPEKGCKTVVVWWWWLLVCQTSKYLTGSSALRSIIQERTKQTESICRISLEQSTQQRLCFSTEELRHAKFCSVMKHTYVQQQCNVKQMSFSHVLQRNHNTNNPMCESWAQ